MQIENQYYKFSINDQTGALTSFSNHKREFLAQRHTESSLFKLRFRTPKGEAILIEALDARSFQLENWQEKDATYLTLSYEGLGGLPVSVTVRIEAPHSSPLTRWRLSVNHDTDCVLEWIDFPDLVVPNDLVAAGGEARLVWPGIEGALIEDASLRDQGWLKYEPLEYPSRGWEGMYPGVCPSQFMAYYDSRGGLYVGAHDPDTNLKTIEYYPYEEGIRLEYRLYPGGRERGEFNMNYDVVLGVFEGDWYDAAKIYRNWLESAGVLALPKLKDNPKLPAWFYQSPVIVIYPVRGTKDTGDMTPNEYFPYNQALPRLEELSAAFGTQVMALLMQWEGTAPWSPPYVWPPFGGVEGLTEFIEQMHQKGQLVGVYCSGIGWTQQSLLTDYQATRQFDQQHLARVMCVSPTGELPYSNICGGVQRWGYDMCPTADFVHEVVVKEISNIARAGCDYIQFFDQNLGGTSYLCYSPTHGHPPAPGSWQKEAMIKLFKEIGRELESIGKPQVLIGCESAAAEPYLPYLPLNDLRYQLNLFLGQPIPLYAYLYHEYINNFMGNQVSISSVLDNQASPLNLWQRLAYSFVAGDLLSVVLKDGGEIHWGWGTDWQMPPPDQSKSREFIYTLSQWRQNLAQEFLCFGKMEKPFEVECRQPVEIVRLSGPVLSYPPVLASLWRNPVGESAQLLVNYTDTAQECMVGLSGLEGKQITLLTDPLGVQAVPLPANQAKLLVRLQPLSVVMLRFN